MFAPAEKFAFADSEREASWSGPDRRAVGIVGVSLWAANMERGINCLAGPSGLNCRVHVFRERFVARFICNPLSPNIWPATRPMAQNQPRNGAGPRARPQRRGMNASLMVIFYGLVLLFAATAKGGESTFDAMRQRAQELSCRPFDPSVGTVPSNALGLTYSAHGAIQFRHEKALWKDSKSPFQVEFFHPGYVHTRMVDLYNADKTGLHRIPFLPDVFTYGTNQPLFNTNGGYAGLRLTHPVDQFGEVATFLGASYFRLIGRNEVYGASCRGVALNTTGKEEFPFFREFWLRKPGRHDETVTILALMDSPSVTGAFEFNIKPGTTTVATVHTVFFPRTEVSEFGVAALTSMFLHDDNGRPLYEDFRPEVHDSDGLLLHTGEDRWIWRPLEKGKMMRVNAYLDNNPKGFGLMQRDRDFEHYQDLVARFERRPNLWIKPLGAWGPGAITLVQLPSNIEYSDNIVAFWVPKNAPRPGHPLELSYEIQAGAEDPAPKTFAHVRSARIGAVVEEPPRVPPHLRYVIDFGGLAGARLPEDAMLKADTYCSDGATITNQAIINNPLNGTWRLAIETTQPTKAVDLGATLKYKGRPISETWNYTWQP
jgi:glucans biosynthesis protein